MTRRQRPCPAQDHQPLDHQPLGDSPLDGSLEDLPTVELGRWYLHHPAAGLTHATRDWIAAPQSPPPRSRVSLRPNGGRGARLALPLPNFIGADANTIIPGHNKVTARALLWDKSQARSTVC